MPSEDANRMNGPSLQTTVASVVDAQHPMPAGVRYSIESPLLGESTRGSTFAVAGWIASKAEAPRAKSVFAVMQGSKISETDLNIYRSDLASMAADGFAITERCGFELQIPLLGRAERWRTSVYGALDAGDGAQAVHLMSFDFETHDDAAGKSRRAPLIVNTIGRTGSTLLCGILAAHPSVVVADNPLAENFFFTDLLTSYFRLTAKSVMSEADTEDVDSLWATRSTSFNRLGLPTDLTSWVDSDFVAAQERTLRTSLAAYYDVWERLTGRSGCNFFLEKTWVSPLLGFARRLFPEMKEIMLVRDFRDIVVSTLEYVPGAPLSEQDRHHSSMTENFSYRFVRRVKALSRAYRDRGSQSCLVRYEDLLSDPKAQISRIARYLQGNESGEAAGAMLASVTSAATGQSRHGTSASSLASIGRWRHALCEPLRTQITSALEADLELFGYNRAPY